MPVRNQRPITFNATGCSEAVDSTLAFKGAMLSLSNMIPSPSTPGLWVPRPASTLLTNFSTSGYTSPAQITALYVLGNRVYGMISVGGALAGFDAPFVYDVAGNNFITVSNVTTPLLPLSPPTSGDWTPPTMTSVGGRIIVTHPGFSGGANAPFFGWFDISNFSLNTLKGNTVAGSNVITNISGDGSSSPILDGVEVGQTFFAPGFFAQTYITGVSNGTLSVNASATVVTNSVTLYSLSFTFGVSAGLYITGPGIVPGTTVVSVQPFTTTQTGDLTLGSGIINNVTNANLIVPGMKVSGAGIAQATAVLSVTGNQVTVTPAATTTVTGTGLLFDGGNTITMSQAAIGPTATSQQVNFSGGGSITVAASALSTANQVALTIAGGTPGAPLWYAGNTNTFALPSVPIAVTAFNQRAYFACGNAVVVSDVGNPTQRSNAGYVLTCGDSTAINALDGFPLESPLTGGIIQAVLAFKSAGQIFQITGDPALNNWSRNGLNVAVGTTSPLAVTSTPKGMAFLAPDGLRIIDFNANVGDVIGAYGNGISYAFINQQNHSRACAAYNQDTLRITVQNNTIPNSPVQEWWYDFELQNWSGPHYVGSIPPSLIAAFYLQTPFTSGHGFVHATNAAGSLGTLWHSDASITENAGYIENGAPLSFVWQTSLLPDNSEMAMNAVIQTALGLLLPPGDSVLVTATDEAGNVLDSVTINGAPASTTVWNSFNWGQAPWSGMPGYFREYRVAWHKPIVFKQAQISVSGTSNFGIGVGNLYLGIKPLGYMLEQILA